MKKELESKNQKNKKERRNLGEKEENRQNIIIRKIKIDILKRKRRKRK